jgi:hypothetical protein
VLAVANGAFSGFSGYFRLFPVQPIRTYSGKIRVVRGFFAFGFTGRPHLARRGAIRVEGLREAHDSKGRELLADFACSSPGD